METEELSFGGDEVSEIIEHAGGRIRRGDFKGAEEVLEKLIKIRFDSPRLYENNLFAAGFWRLKTEKIEHLKEENAYEYGEKLIAYFDRFEKVIELKGGKDLELYPDIKHFVFSEAILVLQGVYRKLGNDETLTLLARALIEIEEYERAVGALEYLLSKKRYDSFVLALLSEACYALGDERRSKAFLREALFYNPLIVPVERMKSDFLWKIKEAVYKDGITEKEEVKLYLGVYGEITEILNIKKRLSEEEMLNLRKTTARFEGTLRANPGEKPFVLPRLALSYFWLIAMLMIEGKEGEINLVLNKLKKLDEGLYDAYLKTLGRQ